MEGRQEGRNVGQKERGGAGRKKGTIEGRKRIAEEKINQSIHGTV